MSFKIPANLSIVFEKQSFLRDFFDRGLFFSIQDCFALRYDGEMIICQDSFAIIAGAIRLRYT
jgi:hypothetical protein